VTMVDIMLRNGVCIGKRNHAGETPLHVAAALGHVAVARYLMAAGADVVIADFGGDEVVDIFGNTWGAFLTLEGRSSFDRAVEGGHMDVVTMMLDKGVDVAAGASRALLYANTGQMVDTLVKAGCSVQDSKSKEAWIKACNNGNVGVSRALSRHSIKEDRRRTKVELEHFAATINIAKKRHRTA